MNKSKAHDLTAPQADARSFDAWFFSQTKKRQDKMRNAGVLPYREMVPSKYVFAIKDEHVKWMEDDRNKHEEVDAFISREHVLVILKAFIDALAISDSLPFRRHVELIRWSLSLPGCLSSHDIAKMYGRSHEAIRKRARRIQLAVNSDALGIFPHINSKRDKMRISFDRNIRS